MLDIGKINFINIFLYAHCLPILYFFNGSFIFYFFIPIVFDSGWYIKLYSYTMFCNRSLVGSKLSQLQSNFCLHGLISWIYSAYSSKNWCSRHYSAVILLSGLNANIRLNRSDNYGVICGKSFYHFALSFLVTTLCILLHLCFQYISCLQPKEFLVSK